MSALTHRAAPLQVEAAPVDWRGTWATAGIPRALHKRAPRQTGTQRSAENPGL